jgi:hypothetical protein
MTVGRWKNEVEMFDLWTRCADVYLLVSLYGGRRMIDKKVEKLKRKIRKMKYWQRYELMDWLNSWYEDEQEYERRCLLEGEE